MLGGQHAFHQIQILVPGQHGLKAVDDGLCPVRSALQQLVGDQGEDLGGHHIGVVRVVLFHICAVEVSPEPAGVELQQGHQAADVAVVPGTGGVELRTGPGHRRVAADQLQRLLHHGGILHRHDGKVAGQGGDGQAAAGGHGAGPHGPVHLPGGIQIGGDGPAPNGVLQPHVVGDDVGCAAALGQAAVDPDRIPVPEALPLDIHGVHGDIGGAHGVDAVLRCSGGVGGAALEPDQLGDEAIAGAVGHQILLFTAGVVAHHDVHIVQGPDPQQLALAAAVADQALLPHLVAFFDLHIFFRRHAEEHHIAVEGGGDLRISQGQGGAHHTGGLGVVAAAVGGAGLRIGVGVVGDGQSVELPHQADGGAVAVRFQIALHAGDGKSLLCPQAQALHRLREFSGGAMLLKAQLGVGPEVLRKGDDLILVRIDPRTDLLFDLVHFGSGLLSAAGAALYFFRRKASQKYSAISPINSSQRPQSIRLFRPVRGMEMPSMGRFTPSGPPVPGSRRLPADTGGS